MDSKSYAHEFRHVSDTLEAVRYGWRSSPAAQPKMEDPVRIGGRLDNGINMHGQTGKTRSLWAGLGVSSLIWRGTCKVWEKQNEVELKSAWDGGLGTCQILMGT